MYRYDFHRQKPIDASAALSTGFSGGKKAQFLKWGDFSWTTSMIKYLVSPNQKKVV